MGGSQNLDPLKCRNSEINAARWTAIGKSATILNVCYYGGAIAKYAAGPPYSVKSQSQISLP